MTTAAVRPSDDEYISIAQFAAIVGKSEQTIYTEIRRGDDLPPPYKFKQYIRFRKSHVDEWIEKHQRLTVATARRIAATTPPTAAKQPQPWLKPSNVPVTSG